VAEWNKETERSAKVLTVQDVSREPLFVLLTHRHTDRQTDTLKTVPAVTVTTCNYVYKLRRVVNNCIAVLSK